MIWVKANLLIYRNDSDYRKVIKTDITLGIYTNHMFKLILKNNQKWNEFCKIIHTLFNKLLFGT